MISVPQELVSYGSVGWGAAGPDGVAAATAWPAGYWIGAAIAAFLLGSVPFSLLIGLLRGVDIRTIGSGNVGATNLGRALGGRYFALGFVCDMLKGLVPVLIVGVLSGAIGRTDLDTPTAWAWLSIAAAAVLGHMFSPWVGFRGGKGVATGLGALGAVYPMLTVPSVGALLAFGAVFVLWRYISLASVCAAGMLPVFTWLFGRLAETAAARRALAGVRPEEIDPAFAAQIRAQSQADVNALPFFIVALVLSGLVIWRHRANLARLAAGTELRAGRARNPVTDGSRGGGGPAPGAKPEASDNR